MPLPVSLHEVADELSIQNDEIKAYINRRTGDLYSLSDEEMSLVEEDYNPEDLPEWQREILPEIRDVLESEDWIQLPTKWEIHEYQIMERFCLSVENESDRDQLLTAIRGKGAFRKFRDVCERLGLIQDWYDYQAAAYAEIAANFLEEEGIPFVRDNVKNL